jgi:hypothetical protein
MSTSLVDEFAGPDPDPDPDSSPDLAVACLACWALVILPQLFSLATAVESGTTTSLLALYLGSISIEPPNVFINRLSTLLRSLTGNQLEILLC